MIETDELVVISERLASIETKIDALSDPIQEFADLVSALKANPLMAQFLQPKGTNHHG
jgi:hypothetical protein